MLVPTFVEDATSEEIVKPEPAVAEVFPSLPIPAYVAFAVFPNEDKVIANDVADPVSSLFVAD